MDSLSAAASVIAIVQILGKLFDICRTYSTAVKDARKDITRLREEITALESVLENVADLEDDADPGQLVTVGLLKKDNGPLQRCQDDLENLIRVLDPGDGDHRMRKYGLRALKWPLASKDVDKAVRMMERYKSLFSLALTGDHTALSLVIKRNLGGVAQRLEDVQAVTIDTRNDTAAIKVDAAATRTDTLAIRTKVEDIEMAHKTREEEKLYRTIVKWLWTTDPTSNYLAACKIHHPDTGQWLIDSVEFYQWKYAKGILLWLNGIPGCGKTIMSSTIIRHLSSLKSTKILALAYYFFTFNDSSKQSPINCLSSLISQICSALGEVPEVLSDLYNNCGKGRRSPDLNELQRILSNLARDPRLDIFIVIDALDECPRTDTWNSRIELLKIISNIHQLPDEDDIELVNQLNRHMGEENQNSPEQTEQPSARQSNIHLLVTSRQEADITLALSSLPSVITFPIQGWAVDQDIKTYVATEVKKDAELVSWSRDIKLQIENTIARGAHGMFRWAYCQLDALRKCKKKPALLRALRSLPKTLDDTYERILLGIDEDYRAEAHRALIWLSFSRRPLDIWELAEAAVIDPDEHFDPDERFHNPERDILDILGSLVTKNYDGAVRLSHYSVKEYLVSDRVHIGFSACKILPDLWCTKICLRYITDIAELGLAKPSPDSEKALPFTQKFSAQSAGEVGDQMPVGLAKGYSSSSASHIAAYKSPVGFVPPNTDSHTSPFPTSTLGIESHNFFPTPNSPSIDSQIQNPQPFLKYASEYWEQHAAENRNLVQTSFQSLLLGVYLSKPVYSIWSDLAGNIWSPLYRASEQGFALVVKRLLDSGSDVMEKGYKGETALHAAARNGFVDIALLILGSSTSDTLLALLDARDANGRTVLHEAALHGHQKLVNELLELSPEKLPGDSESLAIVAVTNQDEPVLPRLKVHKYRANIEATDNSGKRPLHYACAGGNAAVAQLLLEQKAVIRSTDF